MERVAFLGCSRGLGQAVALEMDHQGLLDEALLVARSAPQLEALCLKLKAKGHVLPLDLAQPENFSHLTQFLQKGKVHKIFYFAGGGPYGLFAEKQWKDHLWSLQLSFLTPAQLLHYCLHQKALPHLRQFVVIGSQIADHKPHPRGASYAAAKHGLKGLMDSLIAERAETKGDQPTDSLDIRLFRPGYMDTSLLPPKALPRLLGEPILDVKEAAQQFIHWVRELRPHFSQSLR